MSTSTALSDHRAIRAIRNGMWYWGARIILEMNNREAHAFVSGISLEERLAIERMSAARRYWRFRRQGMTWCEAVAAAHGSTAERIRSANLRRKHTMRARWGGDPRPGTEAYNRRVLATK